MKKTSLLLTALTFVILFCCSHSNTIAVERADHAQADGSEAEILQSWQGDYPVAKLKLLPEKQRDQGVGFINNAKTFAAVWKAFKPGEDVLEIDFKANLVLFARNTQFYNRISIGKVNVKNGVAEVLAMETMSAIPIDDKVAISLAVVAREGITAIQAGDKNIPINTFGQESFKENYNLEFVATPLVMFNPNFGNGGGAIAMALFDMNPEDENIQPSSVAITGLYSDRKSHIIGLGGSFFPNRDFRYKAGFGSGNIKSELNIDFIPESADFSTNFNAVFLEGQYHFAENFFAGLKTIVSWVSYSPDNAAGDAYLKLMDAEDTTSASVGPVVSYDNRDNRFFPYSGIFSEVSFMYNAEALGNDVNYYILEGALNGYRQFRPGHVIGGRLYGRFTPSQTPYPGLSTLGKRSDLRGYVAGEHVANNLVSIQGEYRWNFYKRWWIVGFLGEAALFNKGDLNSDSYFTSVGVGLRYTVSEERRVKIRVDFAWGKGNSDGFYVGLSEAF